jgi:hypothetical protein
VDSVDFLLMGGKAAAQRDAMRTMQSELLSSLQIERMQRQLTLARLGVRSTTTTLVKSLRYGPKNSFASTSHHHASHHASQTCLLRIGRLGFGRQKMAFEEVTKHHEVFMGP